MNQPPDTCVTAHAAEDAADAALADARDMLPGWRIVELAGGGFLAFPLTTVTAEATTLGRMLSQFGQLSA